MQDTFLEVTKAVATADALFDYTFNVTPKYRTILRTNICTHDSIMSYYEADYDVDGHFLKCNKVDRHVVYNKVNENSTVEKHIALVYTKHDEPSTSTTIIKQKIYDMPDKWKYILEARANYSDQIKMSFDDFIKQADIFRIIALNRSVTAECMLFKTRTNAYIEHLNKIQKIMGIKRDITTIRNLVNNPITLTKNIYGEIYRKAEFYIGLKIDGLHSMVTIEQTSTETIVHILTDREIYSVGNTYVPDIKEGFYVYESEMCDNKIVGGDEADKDSVFYIPLGTVPEFNKKLNNMLIFDTFIFENMAINEDKFGNRITHLDICVKVLIAHDIIAAAKKWYLIELSDNPEHIHEQLQLMDSEMSEYDTDGYIIMLNKIIYKWKSLHHTTIDFGLKFAEQINNKHAYWFCHGAAYKRATEYGKLISIPNAFKIKYGNLLPKGSNYGILPFNPFIQPAPNKYYSKESDLDGKIGEFRFVNGQFELVRWRPDKTDHFGNDVSTVESNWINICNPLTYDMLWNYDAMQNKYFSKRKDEIYKPITDHLKKVKEQYIRQYASNAYNIMDIGAGEGQDLFRYVKYCKKIRNLVGVDYDRDAIATFAARRMDIKADHNKSTFYYPNTLLYNSDARELGTVIRQLYLYNDFKINCVFIFMSVHYYVDNIADIIKEIKPHFDSDGVLVIICMDGKKIFDQLASIEKGDKIKYLEDNDHEKYIIEKDYDSDVFESYGQQIKVKLPFSNDMLYPEQLVNIEYMDAMLASIGMTQIKEENIVATEPHKMSKADLQWLDLWKAVVYKNK